MSIALATKGVIGGFMGGVSGEPIYVEVPVGDLDSTSDEVGELNFKVKDTSTEAAPSPIVSSIAMPRKVSDVEIKPTRNAFPRPTNL